MDGSTLRSQLRSYFDVNRIEELATQLHVVERERKKAVVPLLEALIEGGGTGGRQADAWTAYQAHPETEPVVRGAFYSWFEEPLAMVVSALAWDACERAARTKPVLPRAYRKAGIRDILLFDSETIALRGALAEVFPGTSGAALKVHKLFSVGRDNVIGYTVSSAREHDYGHLHVGEHMRGCVLVVDLGYAAHELIERCIRHGVYLVLRLKEGWRPRLVAGVDEEGGLFRLPDRPAAGKLLNMKSSELDGSPLDWDIELGARRIPARLVGVPGPSVYHFCITLLPREHFEPPWVCDLYRARWEIECDNKRDKSGSGLARIGATRVASVLILLHAAMLRAMLVNSLVHASIEGRGPTEPPLHGLALALVLNSQAGRLVEALVCDEPRRWEKLAAVITARAADPNWRGRPSVADRLRGITAPRGRPRTRRLAECPPTAAAYRRSGVNDRRGPI